MGRACTACAHEKRKQIDRLIVQGLSNRLISTKVGDIGQEVIKRHRPHVAQALTAAAERKGIKLDDELVEYLRMLLRNAEGVYKAAARYLDNKHTGKDGVTPTQLRAVGLAIGDQRELILSIGQLLGRIGPGTQITVNNNTLVQIAPVLYKVLEKHPAVLRELEAALDADARGA